MLIGTKEAFDAARDWALRHERETAALLVRVRNAETLSVTAGA
jgi:hypothetical protein